MRKGFLSKVEAAIVCIVMVGVMLTGIASMIAIGKITSPTLNPLDLLVTPKYSGDDKAEVSQIPAHPLGAMVVSTDLEDSRMITFASQEELEDYLKSKNAYPSYDRIGQPGVWMFAADSSANGEGDWTEAPDYSKTNIQVEGVDEADIVKTDGKYIYLILSDRIVIVDAHPAENAKVLCEITLQGQLSGIYINQDKLVIFETTYDQVTVKDNSGAESIISASRTHVKVYDVSDHQNPALQQDVAVDGNYWNSRMIGDYIYVIVTQYTYYGVDLPTIYLEGQAALDISAEQILHPKEELWGNSFTTLVSFNITEKVENIDYIGHACFVLGSAGNLYVSQDNIYIACTEGYYAYGAGSSQTTSVHRIHLSSGEMLYAATGEVPGTLLNQFSMDEYDNHLRVATTTGHVSRSGEATSQNHVYALDEKLKVVGKLENLAPGERIYSTRFMGKRCYLVTFRKVDPLFVIDLSNPEKPEVLGELKITGYSDYLHPYDENHVIGIGKETIADASDTFSWYQGVKISLFDVSDVHNPKEIAKYVIGDRGTDSPVLYDHKALLFDRSRNLLVIPVQVAEKQTSGPDWNYGTPAWQGAYVFHISVEDGLQLRGKITHYEDGEVNQSTYGYGYGSRYDVKRSLYIGDVLYTISDAKINMNDLTSLEEIAEVELPEVQTNQPYYG